MKHFVNFNETKHKTRKNQKKNKLKENFKQWASGPKAEENYNKKGDLINSLVDLKKRNR